MTLLRVHAAWAWVVIVGNGLAGTWALAANWVHPLRVRALWWLVVVVELAISVQVTLGATMVGVQGVQAPSIHIFYGFVALMTVAILYAYRAQLATYRYLLYGFGGLFLMGLAIRAMVLAH